MDAEKYDLLSGQHKYFRVTFDFYTPRPHLVILARDGSGIRQHVLTQEQKEGLVQLVLNLMKQEKIRDKDRPILSFHRGSWLSQAHRFHAHFCLKYDKFEEIFLRHEPSLKNWPNEKFVKRTWRESQDSTRFLDNVKGYPYERYQAEEITKCRVLAVKKPPLPGLAAEDACFHPNEPLVGLPGDWTPDVQAVVMVIKTLEKLALDNELTVICKDDTKGCHVCVVLGPWYDGFQGQPVQGYLKVAGHRYYELLPADRRADWLREFSRNQPPRDET